MSSVKATLLRPGMVIQHEGDLYAVHSTEPRTPGNKRGSMQTRMKNLRTGAIIDYRFRAEDNIDRAVLDEVEFEFLYSDADGYHFMNTETFEQMRLSGEVLGDAVAVRDDALGDLGARRLELGDGTAHRRAVLLARKLGQQAQADQQRTCLVGSEPQRPVHRFGFGDHDLAALVGQVDRAVRVW